MKRMTPMTRSRMGLVALALAAVTVPLPVAAQVIERQAANEKPATVEGTIGMRGTLIRSNGFDPFSSTDLLPQVSLSLQHPFAREGAFGVAAGVSMDYGEANADARGTPSTFKAWRLSVVLEGRYYPRPYAYAFARLAPGMLRAAAVLNHASSPTATSWPIISTCRRSTAAPARRSAFPVPRTRSPPGSASRPATAGPAATTSSSRRPPHPAIRRSWPQSTSGQSTPAAPSCASPSLSPTRIGDRASPRAAGRGRRPKAGG